MDSKTLKSCLKGAVENLKADKYTETVKICKEILDALPNHSRALVFLGKAAEGLHNTKHALEAYKKATESAAADDPLPWQGLCGFYEKHRPDKAEDLTHIYGKLIALNTSNVQKQLDLRVKLTLHLLNQPAYTDTVFADAQALLSELSDKARQYKVKLSLAKYCLKLSTPEAKLRFREICDDIVGLSTFPVEEMTLWEGFATYLYEAEEDLVMVVGRCQSLLKSYPNLSSVCRMLTAIHCNSLLGKVECTLDSDVINMDLLDSTLSELYKYLSRDEPMTDTFSISNLTQATVACASIVLARASIAKKSYKLADEYLEKALGHVKHLPRCLLPQCSVVYEAMVTNLMIQVSFSQQNYGKVISLCRLIETGSGHRDQLLISLIETGNTHEAKNMIDGDKTEDKIFLGYMKMKTELYEEAYTLLLDAVTYSPNSVNGNLWLGWTCYNIPSRLRDSAKCLLMAAKLDTENERAFFYLGLYYNKVRELQRSLKCMKKSYSLNPVDDKICIAYADQLIVHGNTELALEILTHTTQLSSSGSCKWAWFRLGSLRSKEGTLTEAINCFQQALRADDGDSNCWECLADCYVKRGSYTAAIGAFEKACERNPLSVHARYQLALIQHKLELFTAARDLFLEILSSTGDYTPALKGVGDVQIAITREALKQSIYGKAVRSISSALHYLTKAAVIRPDLSCVWKSLGDVLTLCVQLPSQSVICCPTVLTRSDSTDIGSESSTDIDRIKALAIGSRCYAQCKHLRADNSFAWHDLAVNYLYQSYLSDDSVRRRALLTTASHCALKAVTLDKSVPSHYNCLGAIYMQPDLSDPLAAQHHLITGLELDPNNVQGWTNLAVLYIKQGDVELAHEALKIAQSADPKYSECWTGQAIVAEMIGHTEAMDLYRHTMDLGANMESAVGYAHWVLKTLLEEKSRNSENFRYSIERLEAVPVSCLALGNLTGREPSAQSLNAYGLLLERQILLNLSVKALEQCVKVAEDSRDGNLPLYRSNLARVLCSKGDFDACLQQLNLIPSPSSHDVGVRALAQFKLRQFTDSFLSYSELAELTEDDTMKSHVYTAMGMLAVKCGDTEAAKTALFQCSQSPVPSLYGLAALCSLAWLSGDWELAAAALNELIKREKSAASIGDGGEASRLQFAFTSYMYALQGDAWSARNSLLKAIRRYPTDKQLHNQLLALGIEFLPAYRESILRLSQSVTSVQDLVSIASLASGSVKKSFKLAQASVHMYPDRHSNWSLLLSTVHAAHRLPADRLTPQTIARLLAYCMQHKDYPEAAKELKKWIAELAILHSAEFDRQNFDSVSAQLSEELSGSSLEVNLPAFLLQDVQTPFSTDPSLLGVLFQLKLRSRRNVADESAALRESLHSGLSYPALNILLAKLLLQQLTVEENGEHLAEFVLLLEGDNSSSSMLLQAIYHWKVTGNRRLAVKLFGKVINPNGDDDTVQASLARAYIRQSESIAVCNG